MTNTFAWTSRGLRQLKHFHDSLQASSASSKTPSCSCVSSARTIPSLFSGRIFRNWSEWVHFSVPVINLESGSNVAWPKASFKRSKSQKFDKRVGFLRHSSKILPGNPWDSPWNFDLFEEKPQIFASLLRNSTKIDRKITNCDWLRLPHAMTFRLLSTNSRCCFCPPYAHRLFPTSDPIKTQTEFRPPVSTLC